METSTIKLIKKYNNCSIPDNHFAVSDLMSSVDEPFIMDNNSYVLCVRPVQGVHNVQLYKFYLIEIARPY